MADLIIRISGDIKDFQDKLDEAKKSTEDLEGALKTTAEVSAAAFAVLTGTVALSVKAYAESEAATKSLNLALQNQGLYSKDLVQAYKDQADAISALSGVDEDQITQGQAIIQQLIGQTEITPQLTQAMVDLSVKTGSVTSAAEILGRAIDGNVRGLKQFHITVDEGLDKDERMAQILEKVSQQYGGLADSANTGLGSMKGLETAFDDVAKAIGSEFAPLVTAAIGYMTDFFKEIKENKALTELIAVLLGAGIAISGLVALIATIGAAFLAITPFVTAFGISLAAALGPIALAVAGVGLLGAAVADYALHTSKAKDTTEDFNSEIEQAQQRLESYQNALKNNVPYAVGASSAEDLKNKISALSNEIELLTNRQMKANAHGFKPAASEGTGQDESKAAAAKKAAALIADQQAFVRAAQRDHLKALRDALENHDAEVVKLEKDQAALEQELTKDKTAKERAILKEHLDQVKEDLKIARTNEKDELVIYNEEILATNKYYQSLDDAEKKKFLRDNQSSMLATIDNEKKARQKAAKDESTERIKNHNQALQDQIKFGMAYAQINLLMHSQIYEGSKKAFGELAQMQQSSNSTLKAIGKTAAIANIIIKTAESAMAIFAGFSTIPIIGPVLGIAGAAAAVAFGAEQIGTVTSAAQGGLIMGGIPGVDSVPVLAQQGELVAPKQNFDEVVNSVAASRNGGFGGGNLNLVVSMDGKEAERVLTVRQNEAKGLGLYTGS